MSLLKNTLLTLFAAALILAACSKPTKFPSAPAEKPTPAPTAEELLQALGGTKLTRTLPDNIQEGDTLWLAMVYPDGKKRNYVGNGLSNKEGFKADSATVYFFSGQNGNPPHAALIVGGSTLQVQIPEADSENWEASGHENYVRDLSYPLIRFSKTGTINSFASSEVPPEGCFDLVLYIEHDKAKDDSSKEGTASEGSTSSTADP